MLLEMKQNNNINNFTSCTKSILFQIGSFLSVLEVLHVTQCNHNLLFQLHNQSFWQFYCDIQDNNINNNKMYAIAKQTPRMIEMLHLCFDLKMCKLNYQNPHCGFSQRFRSQRQQGYRNGTSLLWKREG